jgi:DNA-binding NarL/FixJ family response regulator
LTPQPPPPSGDEPGPPVTVALVSDLMDRSRVSAAIPGVHFVTDPAGCAGAAVVIVDLARSGTHITEVRRAAPSARIVAFGPHVDEEGARAAREAGADRVLPRSRFFRDPATAVGVGVGEPTDE